MKRNEVSHTINDITLLLFSQTFLNERQGDRMEVQLSYLFMHPCFNKTFVSGIDEGLKLAATGRFWPPYIFVPHSVF